MAKCCTERQEQKPQRENGGKITPDLGMEARENNNTKIL